MVVCVIRETSNVQGPVSRVQHPESRVQQPESSIQSPASRVQCPESSVQSPAFRVQRPESSVQSPASRVQRPESRVQRVESSVQSPASRAQRPESSVQSPESSAQSPGILVCQKRWLFHNLPSKYLQILSTANFVSMWHRIIGTKHQILYLNLLFTGRVRGQWLPYKYHSFFLDTSVWYATSIVRMRICAVAILQCFASKS